MSASADKVQHILEGCLQESAALVRKGVFDQAQLQSMMLRREKYENAMLKREFKLTDYLGAIEYQYQLERERRSRMVEKGKLQESMNPLFKKESSSDFAIVKRIIRLWDRTMHKYKFKLHLWKQYLSLTLAIGSKKHFYKTLTNALRFLPFEVDLWKIGAAYEMEQGKNLWKGRKILIKGMKMVPAGSRNIQLAEFMISYEVHFLRTLAQRRDILIKGEEGIKMIGVEEEENQDEENSGADIKEDTLNLQEYDKIIWLVLEEVFLKNTKPESIQLNFIKIKERLRNLLIKLKREEERKDVSIIIQKVIERLQSHQQGSGTLEVIQEQFEPQITLKQEQQHKPTDINVSPVDYWKQQILSRGSSINWIKAQQALKSFCLKPQHSSQILNFLLQVNQSQTIDFILKKRSSSKLPAGTVLKLIEIDLGNEDERLGRFLSIQIDRWLTVGQLRESRELFTVVVRFNAKWNRLSNTTKLLRSLSIVYRNEPQFLQYCNRVSDVY